MGGCLSNHAARLSTPRAGLGKRPTVDASLSLQDLSGLSMEELFRIGIAEAQLAKAVRVKRDRLQHIVLARELLKAALQQCQSQDEDLRSHMNAVLLKLGEDALALHEPGQHLADPGAVREGVDGCGLLSARHGRPGGGDSTPSDHSSENADLSCIRQWDYAEFTEAGLLHQEDCDEGDETPTNPEMGSDSLAQVVESKTLFMPESREPLTMRRTVGEVLDEARRAGVNAARSIGLSSRATTKDKSSTPTTIGRGFTSVVDSKSAPPSTPPGSATAATSHDAFSGEHLGDDTAQSSEAPFASHSAGWSPGPTEWARGASAPASSWSSPGCGALPEDSVAGQGSKEQFWPSEGSSACSSGKDAVSRRRELQPQQAGGAHSLASKRRRERGDAHHSEAKVVANAELHIESRDTDMWQAQLAQPSGRHTGRQPSQSLSSGSQNGMSDSESSGVTRRSSIKPFGPAIEEEPCDSGKRPQNFRPPPRASGGDEEQHETASATQVARDGHHEFEEGSRNANTPPGSALAPNAFVTPAQEKITQELGGSGVRNHGVLQLPSHTFNMTSPGAQSRSSLDSFSLAGSCLPSAAPSPFIHGASPKPSALLTPPLAGAAPSEVVSVRILNGVSGEEEVRFSVSLQASYSEQHFLSMLDGLCKQRAGQSLRDLSWLSQAQPGERFQRRKCDLAMVEEVLGGADSQKRGPVVLLLCTVPVRPPSELPSSKVRLKNLTPSKVACGCVQPMRLQLDTTVLEADSEYTVAFTHQWSNTTYPAEATLLENHKGVWLNVPEQMLAASETATTDGLYDVHLIIDGESRSDNRRTLTVVTAESEFSSSSTAASVAGGPVSQRRPS